MTTLLFEESKVALVEPVLEDEKITAVPNEIDEPDTVPTTAVP